MDDGQRGVARLLSFCSSHLTSLDLYPTVTKTMTLMKLHNLPLNKTSQTKVIDGLLTQNFVTSWNDWAFFCCWKWSMYFLHVNLSRNCQLSSKTTGFQLRWIEETKTPCSLLGDQPVQKPDMGYPGRTNQGGQKVVVLEIAQVVSSRNKNHTNFKCTNENAKTTS